MKVLEYKDMSEQERPSNTLLSWLSVGDLRSDGMAPQVAEFVVNNPQMLADLLHVLFSGSDIVRGHAADALERVSRIQAHSLIDHLDELAVLAMQDTVPMVRWHLAMILTKLAFQEGCLQTAADTLVILLDDRSAFVKSWAISGLCQIGRQYPQQQEIILSKLSHLQRDPSQAVRTRAVKAIKLLVDHHQALPMGWVKHSST